MPRDIRKRRTHPHCLRATKYAEAIVSEKIPASRLTKLACQRFLDNLVDKQFPYRFNRDRAERFCDFVELMPHVKGKWAGTPLKLEPWQSFIFANLFGWEDKRGLRRFRRAFIFVPRKNGKGLALDTLLPTPSGWTTMGDIKLGDVLYDEQGRECRVTFVSDLRFTDCYEIEFSNGERVVCDGDHLWETTARVDKPGTTTAYPRVPVDLKRVRDTRELFATQYYGKRVDRNHSIDMPKPLLGEHSDLPIDPYVLGVWLGDGTTREGKISCGDEDLVEITRLLDSCGIGTTRYAGRTCWTLRCFHKDTELPFTSTLKTSGLINNKHIPEKYLRASVEQRLALLQGLMDTDGTCDKLGRAQEFCTTKTELLGGFCELLASLGIKYRVREKPLRCNGRDLPGSSFSVQFCVHRDILPVFRLPRKLDRQLFSYERGCSPRSRTVQVVSVKQVDTVTTKCIQVDSPNSLFLFGRTMLPTHNTCTAAPVGLGMLTLESESGSEIYCGAMNEDQADEVFRPAKAMAEKAKGFKQTFGIQITVSSIFREDGLSFFKRLIGKPGDGQSPYCAIHDEYHQHKTSEQVDAMDTGMGARQEPLQLIITTAGFDTSGPCKDLHDYAVKVLEGHFVNENFFSLMYCADPEDDWTDWSTWVKANPNLGVSVSEEYLRGKLAEAVQRTSLQNTVKTKHLNLWVNAGVGWLNMAKWQANADIGLQLENFHGCQAWIGIDLASKIDLTALMILIRHDGKWYLFGRYYLPEETINLPNNEHYQRWVLDGWLTSTPGARTDYQYLYDDLLGVHNGGDDDRDGIYDNFQIVEMVYDPREAEYLMQSIREQVSCPVVEMTQSASSLSEPMKEFEAAINSGELLHSGDPVLSWAAGNVVLKAAANKLYYPAKTNVQNKIDPIVASIMAMARAKATVEDEEVTQGFVEL